MCFRLCIRTFSLNPKSLRFITPRRLIVGLLVLPAFFIHILITRLFMLLDHVFFPHFTREKIERPAFIIGVPRSATTYLLKVMASDTENFTCFRLWEIMFAPSILQKYFWKAVIRIDRSIGRPLWRLSKVYDRIVLGKITKIHETGMTNAEEDEMLLLYTFSSMYLTFFFPDVKATDELIFFDTHYAPRKRKRAMQFYKRCVQRHLFVFGGNGKKKFLSKNPCFISKMESVAETFPDAQLLYMIRTPYRTIPSTISMNSNIYSMLCRKKYAEIMFDRTRDAVIRWYVNADKALQSHWAGRNYVVRFDSITKQPEQTLTEIYRFLDVAPGARMLQRMHEEQQKAAAYSTEHKYNAQTGIHDALIEEKLSELHVRP